MSTKKQNGKICCFCGLTEDNEFEFGKFYEYHGIVTHYYCLLLSSNMEQKGRDNEGILGFLLGDIQKELRRGKKLVCTYCKKSGATLGCCNTKCKRIFHFPCGLKAGTLHQFFGEFRSYCINHRPKQKFSVYTKELIEGNIDVICYICYDKVNIKNLIEVIWAPCCKKDAWFHRKCVQQLASNAGYFFKCPLCNNKKEFQKAMLEQGIFIPSQDASWELEPNAFHELLYRHNRCDAVTCLCPKGRNHTSINAKWELTLCRTCGSQGIHMACGQLKWAKPIWNCDECISILDKVNHSSKKVSETVNITYHGTDTDASDSEISVCESQNKDDFSMVSYSPSSATSQTFEQNPTNISTKNISENNCSSSNQNMFTISSVNSPEKSSNITLNRSENKNISLIDQNKTIIQTNQEKGQTDLKETINRLLTDEKRSILNKSQNKNLQSEEETISRDKKIDLIMIDSDDDIEIISNLKKSDIKGQTLMNMDLPNCDINAKNKNSDQLINISCSSSYIPETYNNQMKTNRKTSDNLNKRKDCEIVTVNNVKDNMFSENENHEDVDNSPVMNIKITNVTSLSPEVFASVPSLEKLGNHKVLQLNTRPSMSLNNFENLQTKDTRLSFSKYQSNETKTSSKRKHETNIYVIGTHTNGVQSVTISSPKKVRTSYLEENMEASCSSTTYNEVKQQIANQNNIKPSQKYVNDRNYQSDLDIFKLNNYRKNKISCPSSTTEVFTPTLELSNHNIAESQIKSAPSWASDANTTINNNVTITRIRNNSTNQSSNTKQNFTKRKTTSSKNSDSSEINNEIQSTLKQFDGDAGTSFTNESTDNRIQRNDDRINPKRASINKRSLLQCTDSRKNGCKKHLNFNSFSEIASNPNACDKPRLIPESVQLQDLKFKVKDSNNVQMILYDTFSVNIHMNTAMKNHVRNSAASVGASNMRRSLLELNDESNIDNCSSTETLYNSHLISDKDMCTSDTIVSRNVIKERDDVKENYYPTTQTSLVTMY